MGLRRRAVVVATRASSGAGFRCTSRFEPSATTSALVTVMPCACATCSAARTAPTLSASIQELLKDRGRQSQKTTDHCRKPTPGWTPIDHEWRYCILLDLSAFVAAFTSA